MLPSWQTVALRKTRRSSHGRCRTSHRLRTKRCGDQAHHRSLSLSLSLSLSVRHFSPRNRITSQALVVLMAVKVYKYVEHVPQLNTLPSVAKRAFADIFAFLTVFAVLLLAFAEVIYLNFSDRLEFHTYSNALWTLWRASIGDCEVSASHTRMMKTRAPSIRFSPSSCSQLALSQSTWASSTPIAVFAWELRSYLYMCVARHLAPKPTRCVSAVLPPSLMPAVFPRAGILRHLYCRHVLRRDCDRGV